MALKGTIKHTSRKQKEQTKTLNQMFGKAPSRQRFRKQRYLAKRIRELVQRIHSGELNPVRRDDKAFSME